MFGIDVRKDSTSRLLTEDQNAVKQHCFSTQGCIRSFVLLLICIRFAIQILWIIVLPNKWTEFSRFCLYLLAVNVRDRCSKGFHEQTINRRSECSEAALFLHPRMHKIFRSPPHMHEICNSNIVDHCATK
ncbi:hypothetical protein AVEN_231753-1 [Araneus ventricosus]|uniref:Uncharacterized protein n=1 Tax=Araneus ventricosus TaxID=182803 RepID=A0A4Y2MS62_ARAVE|nr:hypothetical protein AVEN_231753-1 [Araneus ventricosus]